MTRDNALEGVDREPYRFLFARHPVGREAVAAAGDDEDFAIWLVRLIQEHWKIGHRPVDDLTDAKWRGFYDEDLASCDAIRQAGIVPPPVVAGPRWARR